MIHQFYMKNRSQGILRCYSRLIFPIFAVLFGSSFTRAQLATNPADSSAEALIEQLDADSFTQRNEASIRLRSLGLRAMRLLEQTASNGYGEVADRAFEILRDHYRSDDAHLKEASKQTLESIAKSIDESKAVRASSILKSAVETSMVDPFGGGRIVLPAIKPAPQMPRLGAIKIGGIPAIGNIQVRIGPGRKTVKVTRNNTTTEIVENQDRTIDVTETDAAGAVTNSKFQNEQDLMQRSQKLHRLFKLGGRGNNPVKDLFQRVAPIQRPEQKKN